MLLLAHSMQSHIVTGAVLVNQRHWDRRCQSKTFTETVHDSQKTFTWTVHVNQPLSLGQLSTKCRCWEYFIFLSTHLFFQETWWGCKLSLALAKVNVNEWGDYPQSKQAKQMEVRIACSQAVTPLHLRSASSSTEHPESASSTKCNGVLPEGHNKSGIDIKSHTAKWSQKGGCEFDPPFLLLTRHPPLPIVLSQSLEVSNEVWLPRNASEDVGVGCYRPYPTSHTLGASLWEGVMKHDNPGVYGKTE